MQDAQAAVRLYTLVRRDWEDMVRSASKNIDSKRGKKSAGKKTEDKFVVETKVPSSEGSHQRAVYSPSDSE